MELLQGRRDSIRFVWDRNVDQARRMLNQPTLERSLIVEAMTSAHRSRTSDYASDGNRELSHQGQAALVACIKLGKAKEQMKDQARLWAKLHEHRYLVEIAQNSSLRSAITCSVRQSEPSHRVPLSAKVVAYTIMGLVGAVYVDTKRDLRETGVALNALCRFLDPPDNEMTGESRPLSKSSDPQNMFAPDGAAYQPAISLDERISLDEEEMRRLIAMPDDILMSDWLVPGDPMTEVQHPDLSSPSSVLLGLQNLSLAHTSSGGEQRFIEIEPQSLAQSRVMIDDASRPRLPNLIAQALDQHLELSNEEAQGLAIRQQLLQGPKATPLAKFNPITRSFAERKLHSYLRHQKQLVASLVSATSNVPQYPTLDAILMPAKDPKHQITMAKLYHSCISAPLVVRIKIGIEARRSEALPKPRNYSESLAVAVYHYQMVDRLNKSQVQQSVHTTFQRHYHTYMLYCSLRGDYKAAHDDGFVHNNQRMSLAASMSNMAARPGNPIKVSLAKDYKNMLRTAAPDFDYRGKDEQARLTRSLDTLCKLGVRFHHLVKRFGLGALCLLMFKTPGGPDGELDVSEAEFTALSESGLADFVELMCKSRHPILHFAEAAEPVLRYLVYEGAATGRFRCEDTDATHIESLIEGSDSLLAQLYIV